MIYEYTRYLALFACFVMAVVALAYVVMYGPILVACSKGAL